MRNDTMQPWLMRLTSRNSSVSMISSFILVFSSKVTLSWSMTKIRIPWGEASSNPCGLGPFIVKEVLKKGPYPLVYFEGKALAEPRNGLYLKKYHS
jgi:hypothetical protein